MLIIRTESQAFPAEFPSVDVRKAVRLLDYLQVRVDVFRITRMERIQLIRFGKVSP